jgi:hypothetical protein
VITFTVCLDGVGLGAGHYAGAVTVEGPPGIGPTNVALNVNAKNGTLALILWFVSGLLVLFLLVWRGLTTVQGEQAKIVANKVMAAPADEQVATVDVDAKEQAAKVVQPQARVKMLRGDALNDPMFWIGTLLSAAAAITVPWAVYASNTSWGADPITDGTALVSAVLAAAGFRSLIATAAGK